MDAAAYGASI